MQLIIERIAARLLMIAIQLAVPRPV